jgi:PPM family protein phosphatase
MKTVTALRAAGDTNAGLHREVNEDRFHVDVPRGLFMVIDGVGGQAAGGKAADIALTMLRTRLERETGPIVDRVREAVAIANNEIHRAARLRPEWNGMACVLTVAVVGDSRAVVGHVGDTRLYKLRDGRIDKITHDHSPVGEREDSNEISEREAMHHPRRNEVYRDVGSEDHEPSDPDFVDLHEIPFEPDAALLLCSDGLTDLVDSASIHRIVNRFAGQPQRVVKGLIDAANAAGGKDNVSVVYVEGEQFSVDDRHREQQEQQPLPPQSFTTQRRTRSQLAVRLALIVLLAAAVIAAAALRLQPYWPLVQRSEIALPGLGGGGTIVVQKTDSIAAALQQAQAGSVVVVEPGEYRETLKLKDNVRLVSRVSRGATIRLPGSASEADPAVVATGVTGAEFIGFRVVGDAATPLGTGVLIRESDVWIVDVEVTGAVSVAITIGEKAGASVLSSDIHDNPGAALTIRGASPRIAHNVFTRNGMSERVQRSVIVDDGALPKFSGNVFHGITPDTFGHLGEAARAALAHDNWFPEVPDRSTSSTGARGRRGR